MCCWKTHSPCPQKSTSRALLATPRLVAILNKLHIHLRVIGLIAMASGTAAKSITWSRLGGRRRVWSGSKPSSPSLPEGINCMTVSWLGREGGESGESLKLSPLSSRRRYDITVSWLGEEGGPTRPYRPGESAMGGCPQKEFLSDASGRRVPRGKESEMKNVWQFGRWAPRAQWGKIQKL